jgi:hypothetical protein
MPSPTDERRLCRPLPLGICVLLALACDSLGKPAIHSANPTTDRTGGGGGPAGGSGGSGPSLPPPPDGGGITLGDSGPPSSAPPAENNVLVYAHSGSDLFKVDPQSLEVKRVGIFLIRGADGKTEYLNTVTDIAVDKNGRMTGITFTELLSIDTSTAECTRVAPLSGQLNGLSWIRTGDNSEILAATGFDGSVQRIDPATGMTTKIGSLGNDQKSSGDIVSVASYGTLITLIGGPGTDGSDQLARVDPATGTATVIGPTKFRHVYGVGFWGNRVFGFTQDGEFILIDPKTGEGKLVQRDRAYPFWGAGVSTSAPVID